MKNKENQPEDFKNKTIIITGASSGAGRAMAVELAKHGAKLVLVARRQEALKEVVQQCNDLGGVSIAIPADVRDADAIKDVAKAANEFGGSIDVWINNAGVLAAGSFTDTPIEVHDQVIHTNLLGYLHGAHAVLPYFIKQQHGLLINNISVGGWIPVPYSVGYSASKYGLCGFSEALRGELIKWPDIHVCDLFPAFLDTPGIQHAANYTGKTLKPAPPVYDPQKVARAIVSIIHKPRSSETIGMVAPLLKASNYLFPALTRGITAKVVEGYLKQAEPTPTTSGNVFQPVDFGTSIHGGWNERLVPAKKTLLTGLILSAVAAGILVAFGKRN